MKILNKNTVEMTEQEQRANTLFNHLLDRGFGIHQSARRTAELHPGLDPAFYRWLKNEELLPE